MKTMMKGAYGSIKQINNKLGEKKIVAKIVSLKHSNSMYEVEIMKKLKHVNIIQFHGHNIKNKELIIYLELA